VARGSPVTFYFQGKSVTSSWSVSELPEVYGYRASCSVRSVQPEQPKRRRVWPWIFGAVLVLSIAVGALLRPSAPTGPPSPPTALLTPTPVPTSASVPTAAPTPTSVPTVSTVKTWTMPNLVGANLQDAQDAIQSLTDNAIFLTKSHDATGGSRQQLLDRDWKVCSQNVRPGTKITSDTAIDFGAAKLDERC
jgi:hypothetical protein